MYLISSLLFCALHIYKAAWGVGLTESKINTINIMFDMYRGYNEEIPKNVVVQHLFDMGCYKLTDVLPSEKTGLNDKSAPEFLMTLTGMDKEFDDLQEKGLTSYEVKLFLTMFNIQDKKSEHDGILTCFELVQLFDNDIHLNPNVEKAIKNTLKNDDAINAPMFLAAILEHKPEGKGLDKKQIEKIAQLYTPNSDSQLNNSLLLELLKNLNIVSDAHLEQMDFKNERPAACELQEFLVFWSTYNNEIDGNFFDCKDIRDSVYEFTKYDANEDGLLNYIEFQRVSATYFAAKSRSGALAQYTEINFRQMTVAMFVNMKYILRYEQKDIEADENGPTENTNEMENQNVVIEETSVEDNKNVLLEGTNKLGIENVTSD